MAVTLAAAVAGVILGRRFGHGVKTDGFFAAYGVYIALVLVGQALRVVVLPAFARAREAGRLGAEVGAWAIALALPLAPAVVLALVAPDAVAGLLAGKAEARHDAALLLPWVVPAAVAQIYAGLFASALAALDEYFVAAAGFALGSIASVVLILAVDHGLVVFGWAPLLNGAIAVALPLVALLRRRAIGRPETSGLGRRLWLLLEGVSLPFALQGLYVIANRFALGLGRGEATTFSYSYLIASALVSTTATSIALVSSVPLTRAGLDRELARRHIVSASWLSLAVVAPAAGAAALVVPPVAEALLGDSYGGGTGDELGRLVVYLAPWMVAMVGVSVGFPLLFVRGRAWWLPVVAAGSLVAQVAVEWVLRDAFGLAGVALGVGVTTAIVLAAVAAGLGVLGGVARGLALAAASLGLVAALAFGLPAVVLGAAAAAVVGVVAYVGVVALWRPAGLRDAWGYSRTLR